MKFSPAAIRARLAARATYSTAGSPPLGVELVQLLCDAERCISDMEMEIGTMINSDTEAMWRMYTARGEVIAQLRSNLSRAERALLEEQS